MGNTFPILLSFFFNYRWIGSFWNSNKVAHIAHITSSIIQNSILRYIYYNRSDTMDLCFIQKIIQMKFRTLNFWRLLDFVICFDVYMLIYAVFDMVTINLLLCYCRYPIVSGSSIRMRPMNFAGTKSCVSM